VGVLAIIGNDALTSLTGLDNLTAIGGGLYIRYNGALTSLTGLDNIDAGTITDLSIYDNYNLSTCEIQSICDYLVAPNGTLEIYDNSTGCNNQEEVEEACEVGVDESAVGSWQSAVSIYPNPSATVLTIELPEKTTTFKNATLTISNINGQQLLRRPITEPQTVLDVMGLSSGIYFVKVSNEKTVQVRKFVKQ
jgi:hypothetical protein